MTAEQQFWNWFIDHERELYEFERDQERMFGQLATALQRVDPNLTFEFGPQATRRELVISAAGIKSAFPVVIALTSAAPPLQRWEIIAFRPRRLPHNTIEFRGKKVDPRHVQFTLLDNGQTAGLYLFIPGFRESDSDLKQIGYLLLDETLGEYDVETHLGLIRMLSPDERTEGERRPLTELPAVFDELMVRLGRRTQWLS